MKIQLLAFASAGDAVGASETAIEIPADLDVAGLRAELGRRYPSLGPLWPRLAVGVDGTIARDDVKLREGSEVALLPPVSGG